jgi:hypothetical protein
MPCTCLSLERFAELVTRSGGESGAATVGNSNNMCHAVEGGLSARAGRRACGFFRQQMNGGTDNVGSRLAAAFGEPVQQAFDAGIEADRGGHRRTEGAGGV